jgi:hypothetical protein
MNLNLNLEVKLLGIKKSGDEEMQKAQLELVE